MLEFKIMLIFWVCFFYASIFQYILVCSFYDSLFNVNDCVIIIFMSNFKIYFVSWIYYIFIPFYEENMDLHHIVNESNISGEDICSIDSATTHTILTHK